MHPLLLYYSCSPPDEQLREELLKPLAPLPRESGFVGWHKGLVAPGGDVEAESHAQLARAQAFLLLLSPDSLADTRCQAELEQALQRHHAGQAVVVPILIRPCDWESSSLQKLQPLPRSGGPISMTPSRDHAWVEVVSGIREVSSELLRQPSSTAAVRTNLPPQRNRFFIGRQRLLTDLYERFENQHHPAQASVQALTGLGGIGSAVLDVPGGLQAAAPRAFGAQQTAARWLHPVCGHHLGLEPRSPRRRRSTFAVDPADRGVSPSRQDSSK